MGIKEALSGTSAPTFKFDAPGVTITGTVVSADIRQRTNFDTGEPETWADGKPVNQIRVELSTDLRDRAIVDDEGVRSVWIKAWGDQLRDLRSALRKAGLDDLDAGATLTMTYTGDGTAVGRKSPPKLFAFEVTAPKTAGPLAQAAATGQPPF